MATKMASHPATPATLTEALAEFGTAVRLDDVPDAVAHEARRCLVDHIAVGFAGSGEPGSRTMRRASLRLSPSPQATIVGSKARTSAPFAALLNGYSAHALDFDDTYNPSRTTIHGSASLWPVIFALAELRTISGKDALSAFIAGFEVQARVADAAGPAHYDIGWHVTGTAGHVGAAAAASRVLGLSAEQAVHALGCAATQAAGLKELYGSDCKALHPGKAAMDGLISGVLAEEGITAVSTSLEGPRGLLHVMSADPDEELLVDGLSRRWHLADNGHKAYPSGSLTHPTVDALIRLRDESRFDPREVVAIDVTANTYAKSITGNPRPATRHQARFSLPHCAAIAALSGRLKLADFDLSRVNDAAVARLRDSITIVVDPSLSKRAAEVTVELRDGRRLTQSVDGNRGTPRQPLTDDDIGAKFLESAAGRLRPDSEPAALLERCWGVDNVDDLAGIVTSLAGVDE